VVVAQADAAGGIAAGMAELLAHRHAHGLQRLAARAALRDMPAQGLGAPRLDRGEAPDLAVAHGADLRAVGGPHDVRRVGDDLAVVLGGGPHPGPMRREQGVLTHQPQHPLARDARARPAAAPGPCVRRGGRPPDARLFRLTPCHERGCR
jgi:hypothetical protein